jgi:hypothetical protein
MPDAPSPPRSTGRPADLAPGDIWLADAMTDAPVALCTPPAALEVVDFQTTAPSATLEIAEFGTRCAPSPGLCVPCSASRVSR